MKKKYIRVLNEGSVENGGGEGGLVKRFQVFA